MRENGMMQLVKTIRWLALGSTLSLLAACGGGGGGGDTGGGNGGGNSSTSVSSSSASSNPGGISILPPPLTGRPGETGDLHLTATGNTGTVEVSYRPEGGAAVAKLAFGREERRSLSLPAGIAPDLSLTAVPDGQHCELSVDWRFQVMPRDEEITIECFDRFLLPASINAYPLQWVALPGRALDAIQPDLRVELVHGSETTNVEFVIENGSLLFMMPDIAAGSGQVTLWQGDNAIAEVPLTIVAIPDLDTSTFLTGWFEDQLSGIEDILSPEAFNEWVEKNETDAFYVFEEFQKLSDEDQALVARYLWANMAAINDLLNPLEPFGRRDIIQLQKASLLSCTGHIIRLGSFTAATGYLGLGVVAVGSAVTGPAAPVAIAASGLLVSAIAIKSAEKARVMVKNTVAACSTYRAEPSLLDQVLEGESMSSSNKGRLQKAGSAADIVVTRKFDLADGQTYQTALRVRRVLPDNLTKTVRALQSTLQPISGLFDGELDWLYLFDFDERLLLSSARGLSASGNQIAANTLSFNEAMSVLTVELAFTGDIPERPAPFLITGTADVHDSWLDTTIPVSIELRGHLSGKPPIVFNGHYTFRSKEVTKFSLPLEFATAVNIVVETKYGKVFNGAEPGEFYYFPDEDSTEPEDSFEYEAISDLGKAKGKVTLTRQDECTYQDSEYGRLWVCKYTYEAHEKRLTVSFLIKEAYLVHSKACKEQSREARVFYYDKSSPYIPDHNEISEVTATIKYLTCDDGYEQHAYLAKGAPGENDRTLAITRRDGTRYSEYISHSTGSLNGQQGIYRYKQSCFSSPYSLGSVLERRFSGTILSSLNKDSLLYCPQVQPADMIPFPSNLIVDSPTAYRYGVQLLQQQGISVK